MLPSQEHISENKVKVASCFATDIVKFLYLGTKKLGFLIVFFFKYLVA